MQFRTTLLLAGKTATGIVVPPEVVTALGAGRRPAVNVTINGRYTYRTTISPMGGQYMIPVAAEHRVPAGIVAGEEIDVDVELDTAPREVTVPEDLQAALDADPAVAAAFAKLAFTHRKEHVRAVEEAKAPATRQRRIEKAVATVREGMSPGS